jgi:hypothetical protein
MNECILGAWGVHYVENLRGAECTISVIEEVI